VTTLRDTFKLKVTNVPDSGERCVVHNIHVVSISKSSEFAQRVEPRSPSTPIDPWCSRRETYEGDVMHSAYRIDIFSRADGHLSTVDVKQSIGVLPVN
jgi:hypothetical protein